jgi:hypothetical protein
MADFKILQKQPTPSIGERLGTSLGTGLGAGLQDIMQQRMQALERGRTAKGLQALLGTEPEKAQQLASLPPQLLQEYFKQESQRPLQESLYNLAALQQLQGSSPEGLSQQNALEALAQSGRLTPQTYMQLQQQARDQEKLELGRRKEERALSEKQQAQIREKNKPYIDRINRRKEIDAEIRDLAQKALELHKTGNVMSGVTGKLTYGVGDTRNATQLYKSYIDQIAQLKSLRYPAKAQTKSLLEKIELTKPTIDKEADVQRQLLMNEINESDKGLMESRAIEDLYEQSGGQEVPNLEKRVQEYLKDVSREKLPAEKMEGFQGDINRADRKYPDQEMELDERLAAGQTPEEISVSETVEDIPEQKTPGYEVPEEVTQRLKEASKGSSLGEIARNLDRSVFTVLESLGGMPGGVLGLPFDLGSILTGGSLKDYDQVRKISPWLPPRSKDLQKKREERMESLFGKEIAERWKPQNVGEEMFDEVLGDYVMLSNKALGTALPKKLSAAKAGLGNIAKYLTKGIGGGPLLQEGTKLGTMLLTGLWGSRGRLANQQKSAYAAADAARGADEFGAEGIMSKAGKAFDLAKRGEVTRGKEKLAENLQNLQKEFNKADKTMPVEQMQYWKRTLNKFMRGLNPKTDEAYHIAKPIVNELTDSLKEYTTKNPSFAPFWVGEEISRGLNQHGKFVKFLDDYDIIDAVKGKWGRKILGYGGLTSLAAGKGIPALGATAAIGVAGGAQRGLKSFAKIMSLIQKSPQAQKHYANLIKSFAMNDVPAARRNAIKFDKAIDRASDGYKEEVDVREFIGKD